MYVPTLHMSISYSHVPSELQDKPVYPHFNLYPAWSNRKPITLVSRRQLTKLSPAKVSRNRPETPNSIVQQNLRSFAYSSGVSSHEPGNASPQRPSPGTLSRQVGLPSGPSLFRRSSSVHNAPTFSPGSGSISSRLSKSVDLNRSRSLAQPPTQVPPVPERAVRRQSVLVAARIKALHTGQRYCTTTK